LYESVRPPPIGADTQAPIGTGTPPPSGNPPLGKTFVDIRFDDFRSDDT
jgi:hypothetical protein